MTMKILTGNRPLLSMAPGCLKISQTLFFALSRLYQELFFEARNYWADFPQNGIYAVDENIQGILVPFGFSIFHGGTFRFPRAAFVKISQRKYFR
ncbi:MAG: hypothetical protein PHQ63_09235 [Smithellaceae bacterium]|nr:hypothetical protein [Smithellaceae bacterium]